jgi:hypothetical protein
MIIQYSTTGGTVVFCYWCGVSLYGATQITYLNGSLPCCDLCLKKADG